MKKYSIVTTSDASQRTDAKNINKMKNTGAVTNEDSINLYINDVECDEIIEESNENNTRSLLFERLAFDIHTDSKLHNHRALSKHCATYKLEKFEKKSLIIFNHKYFDDKKKPRLGTDRDVDSLTKSFKKVGFDVVEYTDLTKKEVFEELKKFSKTDFTDHGCVAVAVLSHGKLDLLKAKDGAHYSEVDILDILSVSDKPTLVSKPRILIVQACRGTDPLDGVHVKPGASIQADADSDGEDYYLPMESDILILHSSYRGKPSIRHELEGSWFIQSLCNKLDELAASHDLMSIITEMQREVAVDRKVQTFNSKKVKLEITKQMPVVTSTLIRKLYLKRYEEAASTSNGPDLVTSVKPPTDGMLDSSVQNTPQIEESSSRLDNATNSLNCLKFYAEVEELMSWVAKAESIISSSSPIGVAGLENASSSEALKKFIQINTEMKAIQPRVEAVLHPSTKIPHRELTMRNFKTRWENLTTNGPERQIKLEAAVRKAEEFREALQAFCDWLTGAEKKLASAKPASVLFETLVYQIDEHQSFDEEVLRRGDTLLELDKLTYACQIRDMNEFRKMLAVVQNRWEKFGAEVSLRARVLNNGLKEANTFKNIWNEMIKWLSDMEKQLDNPKSEASGEEDVKKRMLKRKNELQNLQKALDAKTKDYKQIMDTVNILIEKSPDDEPELQRRISGLTIKWNVINSKTQKKPQEEISSLPSELQYNDDGILQQNKLELIKKLSLETLNFLKQSLKPLSSNPFLPMTIFLIYFLLMLKDVKLSDPQLLLWKNPNNLLAEGRIRPFRDHKWCVDMSEGDLVAILQLIPCEDSPAAESGQMFQFTVRRKIQAVTRQMCLDIFEPETRCSVAGFSCYQGSNQLWKYHQNTRQIEHIRTGKCLDYNAELLELIMTPCETSQETQRWALENVDQELMTFWYSKTHDND